MKKTIEINTSNIVFQTGLKKCDIAGVSGIDPHTLSNWIRTNRAESSTYILVIKALLDLYHKYNSGNIVKWARVYKHNSMSEIMSWKSGNSIVFFVNSTNKNYYISWNLFENACKIIEQRINGENEE